MSEIVVENTAYEVVIDIEGGPTLTTAIQQELQTLIETPASPVVIDLNSGARGEPGSALITGLFYPGPEIGTVGDVFIILGDEEPEYLGAVLQKGSLGWVMQGNIRGPVGGINTVNGYTTPDVILYKADVGLGNVDNTSDVLKPISTATQAALDTTVKLTGAQTIAGVKTFSQRIDVSGRSQFKNHSDDGTLNGAVLEVRNDSGNPSIYFHRSGVSDGMLRLNTAGSRLEFVNANGTTYQDFQANNIIGATFSGNGSNISSLNGSNISTGTVPILRLPVAVSGQSSGALIVRADDARLSDARTPVFHEHLYIKTQDVRSLPGANGDAAFMPIPNSIQDSGVSSYFAYVNGAGENWRGVLAVKGWSNDYAVWQIIGPSNIADNDFYLRSGRDTTWNPAVKIHHTGNLDTSTLVTLAGAQTVTGAKTFTGAVIVPTPTAINHAATKGYIDAIVGAAPGTLDTLNELAAALGNDANFATTVTNSIATKVSLSGNQTLSDRKEFTGPTTFTNGDRWGWEAPILISARRPRVAFHSPSIIAGMIRMDDDGTFKFTNMDDNAYYNIRAGSVFDFDARVYSQNNLPAFGNVTGVIGNVQLPDRLKERAAMHSDWNTATETGWWNASDAANAPGAGWYLGEVVAHDPQASNRWVTQRVWAFTSWSDDNYSGMFERRSSPGAGGTTTWSNWRRIYQYVGELDARYSNLITTNTALNTKQPNLGVNINILGNDWNNYTANAVYQTNTIGTNAPSGAYPFGMVISSNTGGTGTTQVYYPHQPHDAIVGYMRTKYNAADWSSWRPMADARQTVFRVLYNGGWPGRPSGATSVEWVGPVVPSGATANDTWVNTA